MVNEVEKNADYYKAIFFVEDTHCQIAHEAGHKISGFQETIYDALYAWMEAHPFFKTYYTEEIIMAVQSSQETFWEDLFQEEINDEYVERQKYFGLLFAEIGIPMDAYLAFLNKLHQLIRQMFIDEGMEDLPLTKAFNAITDVAIALVTDGYNIAINNVLKEQNDSLTQMSTPIAPLWRGILLLPLVGTMTEQRMETIIARMLEAIATHHSKVFIMDISGIPFVDTAVANELTKITKATALMGCRCILSGISGPIAQTIVELGIDMQNIQTTGNMLQALRIALKIVQGKIR